MTENLSSPASSRADFRLLGPFEALLPDGTALAAGRAERTLLALLLLNPGTVLPAGRLIQLLWEDHQVPADPANALQTRVSKLRRTLAGHPDDVPALVTTAGGYRLDVPREAVDVHRFTDLVAQSRRSVEISPADAEQTLERALGMWRGPALGGLEELPWVEAEARRLDDLRLTATEERLGLAISCGRAREAIDPVRQLVEDHPAHEGMTQLLMRALYLSGRQADALDAYRRLRQVLDEELGLEPSAHVRALESQILRQDPALGEPQDVHRGIATLAAEGPTEEPTRGSGRATPPPPRALPQRLSSFVGREEELTTVAELLERHRLVTLVGPGGAGKTSLAIEAARAAAGSFAHGVRLIELAGVTDPVYLWQALADGIGAPAEGPVSARDPRDLVLHHLEDKEVLLLVDNCEHLGDAAAEAVEQLLQGSTATAVLATSREPLGVPGEVQLRVQPLDLPPREGGSRARDFPATRLFLDRMVAANPLVSPSEDDEVTIAAICRTLDGMPLAIELAAARTASLGLAEIAERLADRFALLTQGPRTADERQRTLRATVDWSFDLLTDKERVLLRRMAVFRGGCSLAAAETVCTGPGLERGDVLDILGRLVQRSLVVPVPAEHMRFVLLETVRAYAAEKLADAGEEDAFGRRHAEWVIGLAEESEQRLRGPDQRTWLGVMGREIDNIRAALQWSLAQVDRSVDLPLRLGGSLGWFFHLGRHVEGRRVLDRVSRLAGGTDELRARVLQAQSVVERPRACLVHPSPVCAATAEESLELFDRVGESHRAAFSRCLLAVEGTASMPRDRALRLLGEAEEEFGRRGDLWGQALVAFVRLPIEIKHGQPAGARRYGKVADDLFRQLDDGWGRSAVLFHLGLGLRQFGFHEEAITAFREAVDVANPLGLHSTVQWSLCAAGIAAVGLDELDRARELFESAARTRSEVGDGAGDVHAALGRGLVGRARGDLEQALEHYRVAVHGYRRLGTPVPAASALVGVARCLVAQGRLDEAEKALEEASAIGRRLDDLSVLAWTAEGQAHVAEARSELDRVAEELDRADALRAEGHVERLPFEARELALLRERVGKGSEPQQPSLEASPAPGGSATSMSSSRSNQSGSSSS